MGIALHVDSKEALPGRDDYEWVRGRAAVTVDPDHPSNARVVDLGLVPRGADGLVTFESDVRVLRPAGGGNGRLLSYVPNRGGLGVPLSVDVPDAAPGADPPHPGDGFLLDQGWTVVWVGWQWDVRNGLGVRAPVADVGPGWTRAEWRPDAASDVLPLADAAMFSFADHPTADVDDPDAVLTVRTWPDGERATVPRAQWRFPDPSHVELDGGFRPFHWYELVYRTAHCPVAGVGLVAMRDVSAALGRDFDHTFAYGVSQSGRLLRQLLWEGMNVDTDGEQVFDGVLAHIASSRRGEFNHRYASPAYTHVIGFSNLPPFATTDLLDRQREIGGVPKLMETNSAWEYWRGDGALVHVDPTTGDDLRDAPDARAYLLAGHDHLAALDYKQHLPGANPAHTLDPQPVQRALFAALEAWVVDGVEPPASRVPRSADGTAVTRDAVLAHFGHVAHPDPAVLNVTRRIDLGPDADRGIGRWPLVAGEPYVALVSAVDDDGNEIAGVRVPDVTVPVAVYAGWNVRRPVDGLPDVLYEMLGSRLPFPPDRPTVAERYADEADYAAQVRRAADAMVAERLLLAIDVDRVVDAAVGRYREAVTAAQDAQGT